MKYKNPNPIAILLAAYNAEKYIAEQLDSLLTQTNQDWMLYIRNDGSKDGTQDVIDIYVEKNPEKFIQIDKGGDNLGCRNNFFRLLEVVESEYYMFCDADDVWFNDKIEVSLDAIKELESEYPNLPAMAYGDTIVCDSNLNIIENSYWKSMRINPEKFLSYNYMAVCCTAGGSCSIFNQSVKDALFPMKDNNLIYDYWIAMIVAKIGKFKIIQRPLTYYRQHENQVCGVAIKGANSFSYKLSNMRSLLKQYQFEAQQLKSVGYGPHIKYYWYKFMTILKIRLF